MLQRLQGAGTLYPARVGRMSLTACSKQTCGGSQATRPLPPVVVDTSLVNFQHLNALYIPVSFSGGTAAGGESIYSQYPNYHPGSRRRARGYTCVDDVLRAALAYLRGWKVR